MGSYSFLNVSASIVGPGGVISIGQGEGSAEEGISYAMSGDKNQMTTGADGSVMHSLKGGKSGTITIRLLKTSKVNNKLTKLYNIQTNDAKLHGQNVIVIRDTARGDVITGREAAFKKLPDNAFASTGNTMEWVFDVGKLDPFLGSGTPALT